MGRLLQANEESQRLSRNPAYGFLINSRPLPYPLRLPNAPEDRPTATAVPPLFRRPDDGLELLNPYSLSKIYFVYILCSDHPTHPVPLPRIIGLIDWMNVRPLAFL